MPIIDKHRDKLNEEQRQRLAEQYLLEIRTGIGVDDAEPETKEFSERNKWGLIITNLGMFGRPELLWDFIERVIPMVETDWELGLIATGPIEYLLGRDGEKFIDRG
jgi:hypothetical protein